MQAAARKALVQMPPIEHVFAMENHDEAYHIWRHAGVTEKTLVHIDAHHDMWWIPDDGVLSIANYVCRALQEGLVGAVYWVVPDATWDTERKRRPVMRHLRGITSRYPGASGRFEVTPRKISTEVLGRPLVVCSFASLPWLDEDVLLDIDTDYFVLTRVAYREPCTRPELPWCWPDELLALLAARNLRSSLVTVAYSVQGGYTPLKWKYLGENLAARLRNPDGDSAGSAAMERMRDGAVAAGAHCYRSAEERYREAIRLRGDWAPPHYHLARLYASTGRIAEGRNCYRRAVTLDSSYRLQVESAGLLRQARRHYQPLERELLEIISLDANDSYALFGLARIAAKKEHWVEAEEMLRRSLSVNNRLVDAHRALGDLLSRRGRPREAIAAYEESRKLSLAGEIPLAGPIATRSEEWL